MDINDQDFKSPLPPRRVSVLDTPATDSPSTSTSSNPLPPPPSSDPILPPPPASVSTSSLPKKSPPYLLITMVALIVLALIFLVIKVLLPSLNPGQTNVVTLNYWGLWEDQSVVGGLIAEFEAKNPNIKINYKNNDKTDYRSRLAGRLAKNPDTDEVPDIFRFHSSWLPMFSNNLAAVPSSTVSTLNLDQDFYNVYKNDLKVGNNYYGIPLMYDGLVLLYNQDLIQKAGIELPKSWWDLQTAAAKLTTRDSQGNIQIAGLAMGLTDNVDNWSDILGLLLKQNGVDLLKDSLDTDVKNTKISDVLSYYVNFYSKYRTWDETLAHSTQLFAEGKLAFYFGPSWRILNIVTLNPNLSFGVISVPQLPTLNSLTDSSNSTASLTNIHWATYWAEGVNSQSKHQKEAWKFLEFLASKESMEKMYETAAQVRSFGEIYPRLSLADKLSNNPKLKPFLDSANNAESGYLASDTYDSGLNSEFNKYFGDAINSLAFKNSDSDTVITTLKSGLNQLIQKYHLK